MKNRRVSEWGDEAIVNRWGSVSPRSWTLSTANSPARCSIGLPFGAISISSVLPCDVGRDDFVPAAAGEHVADDDPPQVGAQTGEHEAAEVPAPRRVVRVGLLGGVEVPRREGERNAEQLVGPAPEAVRQPSDQADADETVEEVLPDAGQTFGAVCDRSSRAEDPAVDLGLDADVQEHQRDRERARPAVHLIHPVEPAEDLLEEPDADREDEAPRHQHDRGSADEEAERDRPALLALGAGEGEPADGRRDDDDERAEPRAGPEGAESRDGDRPVASAPERLPTESAEAFRERVVGFDHASDRTNGELK